MKHSKLARDLISEFGGRKALAYPDPATGGDPWTIGVGHTGPEVRKGVRWTEAQIDAALDADLRRFDEGVTSLIGKTATTQPQFDALVSFAFNLGLRNLGKSTLLTKHRVRDYAGAALEFQKWNKAAGKVMAGLTRRRAAEAALYRKASS